MRSAHIGGPVLDTRMDDVELEGEDMLERRERVEDVRRFCRSLVEEAQAGEGGEAEGPELW